MAAAKPAPAGKVNINTATAQQLSELPGVGEKLAARIVEYRQKSGGFKTVQELMNVQGIGEKNFASMQPHLTVGRRRGQGRFQQVDGHGGGGPAAPAPSWRSCR